MPEEIWVFLEIERDEIRKVSLETLCGGRRMADAAGLCLGALLMGSGAEALAAIPGQYGADKVYLADRPELSGHDIDTLVSLLQRLAREEQPGMIFFGATPLSRELAPRLAVRLKAGLLTECMDLKIEKGQLTARRPVLNGKAQANVTCSLTGIRMATVCPGVFDIRKILPARSPEIHTVDFQVDESPRVEFIRFVKGDPSRISLNEAEVIIAVGRGLQDAGRLPLIEKLAELIGASLGGTRVAVDLKWIPPERQIGITGQVVSPRLFISCGISGQYPHTAGMDSAETIIVINNDREAPMFKLASLGILGSLEKIVPALIKRLEEALPQGRETVC